MNKKLNFTQEQVTKILEEIAESNDGFNKVLKYSLEALMRAERNIHNKFCNEVSNGYRRRKVFSKKAKVKINNSPDKNQIRDAAEIVVASCKFTLNKVSKPAKIPSRKPIPPGAISITMPNVTDSGKLNAVIILNEKGESAEEKNQNAAENKSQ